MKQTKPQKTSALIIAITLALAACAQNQTQEQTPSPLRTKIKINAQSPAQENKQDPQNLQSEQTNQTQAEPLLILGTDKLINIPAQKKATPINGQVGKLEFENAPVTEVIKVVLGELLKVDYIIHPPLTGNVTFSSRQSMTADRALFLLEQALQASGIVMSKDARGTYHVGTPASLQGIISAPQIAGEGYPPLRPGYGTILISPEHLGAGELANILRPMVSPESIIQIDTARNLLVMRGTRVQAEGWLDIVKTFDVNMLRGMSIGVFPLKYTSTAEAAAAFGLLSEAAQSVASQTTSAQTGQTNNLRAAQASQASQAANKSGFFGSLRIMPIERINALMVISPRAAYLDEVKYWLEQFDKPNLNSAEPQLFVYKVQNGSAEHLSTLLNGIYGASSSSAESQTGVAPSLTATTSSSLNTGFASTFTSSANKTSSLGGTMSLGSGSSLTNNTNKENSGASTSTSELGNGIRVMADKINNTLLIHASPAEYAKIENTLKRLDIQRAQVLIEATIVEVTLGDGIEYGLQWAFNGGVGNSGRSGVGLLGTGTNGQLTGAANSAADAFTYTLRNAAGNISAVLSALASKSLIKVISSPSLMVLDNHTAAIQVGNQQPVSTGTVINTSSNYTTSSIQYKDTGVMLGVTPSVSAGDLVTLDISQTVTDLGNSADSATSGYPTFMQRQIESKVAVRSGETLVLGGLIQDRSRQSKSGLPILSSIPVLGALFGQQQKSDSRTELLVIFTPRVLRSDEDARAVSRELRQKMQGLLPPPSP